MAGSRSLVLDLEVGESLEVTLPDGHSLSSKVSVTVLHKSGKRARIRVSAPPEIKVARAEHDEERELHLQNWVRV